MALEVLVIRHGQSIKIPTFFGLSSGYPWSRTYVQQEFLALDTMQVSARAVPQIQTLQILQKIYYME